MHSMCSVDEPADVRMARLLDLHDLARLLRLRARDGGWSAEAARKFVADCPELRALAFHMPGRGRLLRWRADDVALWLDATSRPTERGEPPQHYRTGAETSGKDGGP